MGKVRAEYLAVKEEQAKRFNVYFKDETTEKCYGIPTGFFTIGRRDDKDVDIAIETEDTCISRIHADVKMVVNMIGEFSLFIRDTTTRLNPTEVNERPIGPHFFYQLYDGDVVQMGYTDFTVHLNPIVKKNTSKES